MIIVNEFIEDINIIENELNIVICNETSIRDTVYYGFLNYFGFKSLKYKNINELVVVDSKYEKINKKRL